MKMPSLNLKCDLNLLLIIIINIKTFWTNKQSKENMSFDNKSLQQLVEDFKSEDKLKKSNALG